MCGRYQFCTARAQEDGTSRFVGRKGRLHWGFAAGQGYTYTLVPFTPVLAKPQRLVTMLSRSFTARRPSALFLGALILGALNLGLLGLFSGCTPSTAPSPEPAAELAVDRTRPAANGESSDLDVAPRLPVSPAPALPQPRPTQPDAGTSQPAGPDPAPPKVGQPASAPAPSVQVPPTEDNAGGEAWLALTELPYEYWETQYLNGSRIGVTHYKVEKAGLDRLTLTASSIFQVQRAGQPIRQTVTVQTIEHLDGRVDSYFEDIEGGGGVTKVTGSVSNGTMPLRISSGQTTSSATVQWPSETWGPMGVHQLLLRRPMRSGERRLAQVFLPQIHKTARVTLTAGNEEDTTSPDGLLTHLVPVDVVMQLDNEAISNRVWTNAKGEVLKSVMTIGLNLSSYRVSREMAEKVVAQGQVDLFEATSIQLAKPLIDPDKAARVVYAVEAKETDPFGLLSQESNQAVRSDTAFRAELTVWRPTLSGELPKGAKQTPPSPECLASSPLIKSDDPLVAKLATHLAGSETEPAKIAQKLTEGVYASIRKKNFSRSFDTAQDVARTLEGDCTEHAVLLAALLRNRGIPARLASGVIVQTADGQSNCVYHMWTEAWLGKRWLPLDATQGTVAGCGHIKFLETPLAESNPYVALLPVMTSLGQLSISVEEVER